MNFREITLADLPALFAVRVATHENRLSYAELAALDITVASVADKLQGSFKGWLCEVEQRIVGFAIGDRATGELWVIAVLPEYLGQRIGSRLLTLVENWLRENGCSRLWLTTDLDPSLKAYAFYRAHGWEDERLENGLRYMEKRFPPAEIAAYWEKFLASLPAASPYRHRPYLAEGWGDGPEMADELGALIAAGTKTATCSSVWEWEAEGQPWPQPGALTIVLDGRGQPLCLIETTEVTLWAYNQVDAQFASDEGEGDRSLAYWREVHRWFFTRSLAKIGREFDEAMPLVCERFQVIFKEAADANE